MYPIFLKLDAQPCLVVGAGRIAERKTLQLVAEHAEVTVIAPEACSTIMQLARDNRIRFEHRPYQAGEAAHYFLVITATGDRAVNSQVARDALEAGRPVNSVDDPELCTFYAPAIVKRGLLRIAISTSGGFPMLSRRLKQKLTHEFGPEYEPLLEQLKAYRERLLECESDPNRRREQVERIIDGEEIDLYLQGNPKPLESLLKQ